MSILTKRWLHLTVRIAAVTENRFLSYVLSFHHYSGLVSQYLGLASLIYWMQYLFVEELETFPNNDYGSREDLVPVPLEAGAKSTI